MATVGEISSWLDGIAPPILSEAWDNTGLLLGDADRPVSRAMCCLTLTATSVDEAIAGGAHMVIAHHPLPFKPLSRITTESTPGRLVWRLASAGISVYSPHTAWDSAESGINSRLAEKLGLRDLRPLIPNQEMQLQHVGAGRVGELPEPAGVTTIAERLLALIPECRMRMVESDKDSVSRIGLACGSGASLLDPASAANCELFITGEATFHHCLEAQAAGVAMLMMGHYASERFSLEELARMLGAAFPAVHAWASQTERDPVKNLPPRGSEA